jgi:hypothetical protein
MFYAAHRMQSSSLACAVGPIFTQLCPHSSSLSYSLVWQSVDVWVRAGIRSLPNRFIKTRARPNLQPGLCTLAPCFIYSPVMSNRCLRTDNTLKLILVTFYLHSLG